MTIINQRVEVGLGGPGLDADLQACPLVSPTTILYGEEDTVAPVRKDFASCRDDPRVKFVGFPGGHFAQPKQSIARLIEILDRGSSDADAKGL